LADFISQIRAPGNWDTALRDRFPRLPIISFDYAIMEKADRVLMVEATFRLGRCGRLAGGRAYLAKDAIRTLRIAS
jgi:mannose-1-phosphate guanylyltransferase